MKKIMFVCHGNICRSPMAEFVMKSLAAKAGAELHIESSATSNFDMVVVMEDYNKRNLLRLIGCDCEGKVWKLLDFVSDEPQPCNGADISDPWYHGNFDKTYKEIEQGCKGLLEYLGY